LLSAQSRKTRAEALNTELQEPYNKALADVYGSIAGVPAAGMKALGGVATGYGMYRGAKTVGNMDLFNITACGKNRLRVIIHTKSLISTQLNSSNCQNSCTRTIVNNALSYRWVFI
jgi:hypothetical protein